jgi:hypothetical protein
MGADWTRLQPPAQDQRRPTLRWPRPAAITTGKAVRGHKNSRLCAGLELSGVAIPAADLRCASRVKDGVAPVNQCIFVVHLPSENLKTIGFI